jgi:predicted RNase H-like nuclease (RuvC/YqgF family)
MTTQEEKIRVNARIPKSLYDWISSEYDNVSQAINEGLERLKESKTGEMSYNSKDVILDSHTTTENVIQSPIDVIHDVIQDPEPVIQDDIRALIATTEEQKSRVEEYKAQFQGLNAEISRLKAALMEAPDPVDLVRLQERNDGLNLVIAEKEKRIEELNAHKENMSRFADYFRSTEPKLIESPVDKRKKPWWKFW